MSNVTIKSLKYLQLFLVSCFFVCAGIFILLNKVRASENSYCQTPCNGVDECECGDAVNCPNYQICINDDAGSGEGVCVYTDDCSGIGNLLCPGYENQCGTDNVLQSPCSVGQRCNSYSAIEGVRPALSICEADTTCLPSEDITCDGYVGECGEDDDRETENPCITTEICNDYDPPIGAICKPSASCTRCPNIPPNPVFPSKCGDYGCGMNERCDYTALVPQCHASTCNEDTCNTVGACCETEAGICGTCVADTVNNINICDTSSPCPECVNPEPVDTGYGGNPMTITQLIQLVYNIMLPVTVGMGIYFIVRAGYILKTSQGNPQITAQGKEDLTAAIVGMLFIAFSLTILKVIINAILGANLDI
ncbi:MAG: hypothetical protein ACD_22C00077G0002 [uncultured bacterium]|nr:MAG: hypothetical protein ACD_22C00077G0002 [uncultured bacterium]